MNRQALNAALAISMAVCTGAAARPYHQIAESADGSGYFDVAGENGRWAVGYTGEAGQSDREVAEHALRRAAELAAEQHQEWFAVITATNRMVEAGAAPADDLSLRAGIFMGGHTSAEQGAPGGGFGSAQVPSNMLERWQPRRVRQTILVVELGSGDEASFPGLDQQPQIFPAGEWAAAPLEPAPSTP
jgi:hypothetical protein